MADLIPVTTFADGEEINEAKLYTRVFTPINGLATQVTAGQVGDGGWIAAALTSPWVNSAGGLQTMQYRLLNGIVTIEGTVKSGAIGGVVFTLPAGYRPALTIQSVGASGSGAAIWNIRNDGVLFIGAYISPGSNGAVSLAVSYPADV